MRRFALATTILGLLPFPCMAQWTQHFIRATCVPESMYFALEYHGLVGPDIFDEVIDPSDKKRREVMNKWRRQGYLDASRLSYECKLSNAVVFRVRANQTEPQATGMCGGDPRIALRLERNDKTVFENVAFGNGCVESVVDRVEFYENSTSSGYHFTKMNLCVVPESDEYHQCTWLSDEYNDEFSRSIPITTEKLLKK
jgi:hypothetical protein